MANVSAEAFLKAISPTILEIAKDTWKEFEEATHIKLKTAYKTYIRKTSEKFSKSKTFFLQETSSDLYKYYVPIGIQCNETSIENPDFSSCLKESSRIAIIGTGGSGKSVLLKHLFLNCLKNKTKVPILIELRDLEGSDFDLLQTIKETLETYGFFASGDYFNKAIKAEHFAFFLDGYDEVSHKHKKRLIRQIKKLSDMVNGSPIFITSRPDQDLISLPEFDIYKIKNLSLDKASKLVQKLPYDEDIKRKFKKDLKEKLYAKHTTFLSNPLLLSIMLITYGENAEIPTKINIFYNQAYEALFQRHDARKGAYKRVRLTNLDIQEFEKVFGLFCLLTYMERAFTFPKTKCFSVLGNCQKQLQYKFEIEHYLQDCLDAVCLLIEDGLEITFSHRSFQEYFVAKYALQLDEEIRIALLKDFLVSVRSDNVLHLMFEMNKEAVEKDLIIPHLEKLFEKLDIKKSIGVTHHTKFLKLCYSELSVETGQIGITPNPQNIDFKNIVQLVNELYHETHPMSLRHFDDFHKKHSNEDGSRKKHKFNKMTFRTPILKDLGDIFTFMKKEYLENAYETYKEIKNKNEKSAISMEKLLGLNRS